MKRSKFGSNLQNAMQAANMKQHALGEAADISQATVSRLLSGEYEPSIEQVDKLAGVLGVGRYALIGGTDLASKFPTDCLVTLNSADHIKWLGYFASGLTGLNEAQRVELFADAAAVREECEGVRAFLYEPANYTDPILNKDVPAEEVYMIDHAQVTRSHFMVLHTRHPSFGAGQELEIAKNAGIPVILLQDHRAGTVSRMVLGTCARIHQVHFGSREELKAGLKATFTNLVVDLLHRHSEADRSLLEPARMDAGFSERLRAGRVAMRIDEATLARHLGLETHAVKQLESGEFANPSLTVLRRIADILKTTVAHLTDGVPNRAEDQDPVLRQSHVNLLHFGQQKHVPVDEVQKLWDYEYKTYTTGRRAVAEARSAPVTYDEWAERYATLKSGVAKPRQLSLDSDD